MQVGAHEVTEAAMVTKLIARASVPLADPGVRPNHSGLPGMNLARQIAGALMTFGLIASVAGLVLSTIVWVLAAHHGNTHYASRGRMGVLVAAAAALLIGGADAIVTFFQNAGTQI